MRWVPYVICGDSQGVQGRGPSCLPMATTLSGLEHFDDPTKNVGVVLPNLSRAWGSY